MTRVFLDTNFCLLPFEKGVDIIRGVEELVPDAEISVPDFILLELEKLSTKKKSAKTAVSLIRFERIKIFKSEQEPENNDKALAELARVHSALIATNDKALRKLCKRAGIGTIFLRKNKVLRLD